MALTSSPPETEPLLSRASPTTTYNDVATTSSSSTEINYSTSQEEGRNRQFGDVRSEFQLFKDLLIDSIPVILSYILQNSIQTISVVIVGRLGPEELSVAAFSLMLAFVTGWVVALGGTTALDTLGSQAFTGSPRPTDLSVHFQRCLVLLWMLLIPVCVLWAFIEPVLLALGQSTDLSHGVQNFLRVLIFGAPGYIGFESLKKYLQCQGIMGASTIVLIIISPINLGLNIALVHYTSLGLLGSPVALSIVYWLAFLFLTIFTYFSPTHRRNGTWGGFRILDVFHLKSCMTFLRLALPGILMVGTEWAAFEIVALAAGRLGALPLAAQSVIMTFDQILNTLPFGIGVAASNRVGNLIGSRSAVGAKHAAHAAAFLSVIVGAIVMIILIACRDVCGYVLSDDADVVRLVSLVMPLVASFQISDGLAGSCGGSLRGLGRQHLGAIFNFVAYYVIALPLGIGLAFRHGKGLQGLWIGQVVGLTVVGLSEYAVVWLGTDWEREVEKGVQRNAEEAKRLQSHSSELTDGEN
ncbi:MATE efflux family protein [Dendrothele bispora CBS 962.96]|uniref:MATE efflux family protein n=1 Tax=Dendrothele bispora (strain CBS 962.96) TaxID=1314807 RepID=A0A4S8M605_DENBC|nr:MATE efflux family protein [Dendrothele bispora CBS 962.96]